MKRITVILFFSIIVISCSSKPAPGWQQDGFINMNNYINNFMQGNDKFAENYYKRLLENLKMTTDPDEIVKGHLIKCSLDYSIMDFRECSEAAPFVSLLKKDENISYYNFISGKKGTVPSKYKKIEKNITACDENKLNSLIKKLEEPLSRLIASSFAVKEKCFDENTLLNAIDTASSEGWKRAAQKYIEFTIRYYEKNGKNDKAENLRKRIDFSRDEDQ